MRPRRATTGIACAALTAACVLPALDLANKFCPCTADFACVDEHCVPPGTLADAPSEDQGAPEAAPPSDAPPSTFCGAHPGVALCADFDDTDAPWGFDQLYPWGGGKLGVDPTNEVSAPNSAFFDLPALGSSGQANATLVKAFSTPIASKIAIELDVLIEALDATNGNETSLVTMTFDGNAAKDEIRLAVHRDGARVVEITTPLDGGLPTYAGGALTGPLTAGPWRHVKWTITRTATTSTSDVLIPDDEGGYVTGTSSLNLYRFNVAPKFSVGLLAVAGPSGRFHVRVDNVLVTIE